MKTPPLLVEEAIPPKAKSVASADPFPAGATDPTARPQGQINALTSLRGWLALWVVFYHFWDDVLRLSPSMAALSPLVRLGHMAVPAFFMLSGFVLAYTYSDRFHRLNGPRLFASCVCGWPAFTPSTWRHSSSWP